MQRSGSVALGPRRDMQSLAPGTVRDCICPHWTIETLNSEITGAARSRRFALPFTNRTQPEDVSFCANLHNLERSNSITPDVPYKCTVVSISTTARETPFPGTVLLWGVAECVAPLERDGSQARQRPRWMNERT